VGSGGGGRVSAGAGVYSRVGSIPPQQASRQPVSEAHRFADAECKALGDVRRIAKIIGAKLDAPHYLSGLFDMYLESRPLAQWLLPNLSDCFSSSICTDAYMCAHAAVRTLTADWTSAVEACVAELERCSVDWEDLKDDVFGESALEMLSSMLSAGHSRSINPGGGWRRRGALGLYHLSEVQSVFVYVCLRLSVGVCVSACSSACVSVCVSACVSAGRP